MKEDRISAILLELSAVAGVSGNENAAVEIAARHFRRHTEEVRQDRFGNLLALKLGAPAEDREKLTLAVIAHIDEIGFMVTNIEKGGFLRFTPIGGIDPRTLPGQAVEIHGKKKLKGVIGAAPPHLSSAKDRKETVPTDKLFIDPGLSEDSLKKYISIGDYVSLEQKPLKHSTNNIISGKALDNRAGITALIFCAEELKALHHQADVCFVSSLQEEVGLRGAITNAYNLQPDLAIIVDVTHGDVPGLDERCVFKVGGGPTIAIGPNLHPVLSRRLEETARERYLPYQKEPIPGHSGTDAWAFQVSREGIPTALLSIPLRYMHTAVELISMDDLLVLSKLICYFAGSLDSLFLEELKKC
ncbi:MAG: M42 family metallopeptidase [Bacillota bacterium]